MFRWILPIVLVLALSSFGCGESSARPELDPQRHSELWGVDGERWSRSSRLPDFSWAGYRNGTAPPTAPPAANVHDYGAVGDGDADDTEAFLAAIADTAGVLEVPAGRYRIEQPLKITKSDVVLRGAGPDRTTLFFPRSLREAIGVGPFGGRHGWAWGGGWIWLEGAAPTATQPLATVVEPAERGSDRLRVASTANLTAGTRIRLVQYEIDDGSLTRHLHNGHALGGKCWIEHPGTSVMDWTVRLAEVGDDWVRLEQALRIDVDPRWSPAIHPVIPTVREVGIEELTIEFPETEYAGHHLEPGYNAVYFSDVADSWVRNVRTIHSDSALSFWHSRTSTATGLEVKGRSGHYGINLAASQDCLVTDFEIANRSLHDLSVAMLANGNVFSNGRGVAINFDHHRGAPYENLFSDIDVGESWRRRRLWDSSYTASGHYSAARETFWNIRPRISTRWLPAWPQQNIIGALKQPEASPHDRSLDDTWVEAVPELAIRDLHRAQLTRRMPTPRSH